MLRKVENIVRKNRFSYNEKSAKKKCKGKKQLLIITRIIVVYPLIEIILSFHPQQNIYRYIINKIYN